MTAAALPRDDLTARRPLQVSGHVFDVRRSADFVILTIVAEGIPDRARPGSFVMVAVGDEASAVMLPRPMWVHRVRPAGRYGGTFQVAFRVRGPGTAWLASRRRHDVLELVGPLGRPFPLPRQPVCCLLTGVDHGVAPLLFLAEQLVGRGCEVHLATVRSSGGDAFGSVDAKRLALSVTMLTDTGPDGDGGGLAARLGQVAAERRARVVYACGPGGFAGAAADAAAATGVPAQVAVEMPTACGTGVCAGCLLPTAGEESRPVRACVDGPVFAGDAVDWARLVEVAQL